MVVLILLWWLATGAASLAVEIYKSSSYSSNSDFIQATLAQMHNSTLRAKVIHVSSAEDLPESSADFVLDYLNDAALSSELKRRVGKKSYFAMWQREYSENRDIYVGAFVNFLSVMNFTGIAIVSSSDPKNLGVTQFLAEHYPGLFREISVIPEAASLDFSYQFVGRTIKPRGINFIAIFADEQSASHLLQALEYKNLNRAGYAYILSQQASEFRYSVQSASGLLASGVLFVAEDCAKFLSRLEFEICRLTRALKQLDASGVVADPTYSLFALNSSLPQTVSTPSLSGALFPGGTTTVPQASRLKIRASVNYVMTNPDGSVYPLGLQWMRGFQVAFSEANNRTDLIPSYYLEDFPVSFAGMSFNRSFTKERLERSKKDFGLIYMSTPSTQSIVGISQLLVELNMSVPITTSALGSMLSDAANFPMYLRPRVSGSYIITSICRLSAFFGWKKIAVLYSDDNGDNADMYSQFMRISKIFNINVTNPEDRRKLPALPNNETMAVVDQALIPILQGDTRILCIMHSYQHIIIDELYALGAAQEYAILLFTGLSDAFYSDQSLRSRRYMSKGALQFFPRLFVGSIGDRVRSQLLLIDGKSMFPNTCFMYDAAYMYFHATDFLLEKGRDYEDPRELIQTMRETYFQGCGGFFKIESGTNDRVAGEVVVTNFQYSSNDSYVLKVVGSYNPYSVEPYHFPEKIQWPDDAEHFSDTKPKYSNCPFLASEVRPVLSAKATTIAINFGLSFAFLPMVFIMWRRWRRVQVPVLRGKRTISPEDSIPNFSVVCDFFQFTAVGPGISYMGELPTYLAALFSVSVDYFIDVSDGVYWLWIDVVLLVVGLWTPMSVVRTLLIETELERKCSTVFSLTDKVSPLIGDFLFLPITSVLTSVFVCHLGVSDRLTDSFMEKDCFEFCWRERHIGYAAGSAVALLCYTSVAAFLRPMWQEMQKNLHVRAQPRAIFVKSALQMLLAASANSLRVEHPHVHSGIFLVSIAGYLVFMLRFRQFNYDRLNMWHALATLALLVMATGGFLARIMPKHTTHILFAVLIALSLLAITGIMLQRFVKCFESKLSKEKSKDVRGLFVFAFTGGERAQEGLREFYSKNQMLTSQAHRTS